MKPRFASLVAGIGVLALLANSPAAAHYLWVTLESPAGEHGVAHVIFEEAPAAGDGEYLQPFVDRGTTWIRTLKAEQPQPLKMQEVHKDGKRWLTAELPTGGSRSVDSYGKWGVYRYGQTDVLLHYYARHLDVRDHDDLHALGRAEQMALDLVAHEGNGELEIRVVWHDKPAAERPVYVRGPKGFKATLTTDESGEVRLKPEQSGAYTFRTFVEQEQSGTDDGKEYAKIRHNGTLLLSWPIGAGAK
jgi:hypothetical protein